MDILRHKELSIITEFIKSKTKKDIFLVGGTIRDLLLGYKPNDVDLTGSMSSQDFQILFGGEITEKFGTVFTRIKGYEIEYTPFRIELGGNGKGANQFFFGRTLEEDAKRRDFTINAIYYNIQNNLFVDPENGITDIKNKVLKCVGNPQDRFKEDYLRIFRGVRLFYKFKKDIPSFKIEDNTYNQMILLKENLDLLSGYRIKQELFKGIMYPSYIRGLIHMGILQIFFPEIEEMNGLDQNTEYHIYDVLEHSLQAYEYGLKHKKDKGPLFLFSVLFHDIGKPLQFFKTRQFVPGSDDFRNTKRKYAHSKVGYHIIEKRLERLLFSNNEKSYIKFMINCHQHEMLYERFETTEKMISKFIFKNIVEARHPSYTYWFLELVELAFCDRMGTGTRTIEIVDKWYQDILNKFYNIYDIEKKEFKHNISIHQLAINGYDFLEHGYKGKAIGTKQKELLKYIERNPKYNTRKILLKQL